VVFDCNYCVCSVALVVLQLFSGYFFGISIALRQVII
jgi:hypothetical protein